MRKPPKVRLFSPATIQLGQEMALEDSGAHYLLNVLRMASGDSLKMFDGQTGEYICEIGQCSKKSCKIIVIEKTREFEQSPDLWLLFAPVKKDKTDFIIASATELGVRKIVPVITKRTISEKIKKERYVAQVVEASEQSRRVDIPEVYEPISLENLLANWDKQRILYFMDETGNGGEISSVFGQALKLCPSAILVGPEGGFEETELELLRKQTFAKGVSMGKRILRAETAVTAALSCWQAQCGDWAKP